MPPPDALTVTLWSSTSSASGAACSVSLASLASLAMVKSFSMMLTPLGRSVNFSSTGSLNFSRVMPTVIGAVSPCLTLVPPGAVTVSFFSVSPAADKPMKRQQYDKELRTLQIELCALQDWVRDKGLQVIVVFEGRDAAGTGGTIKAITERVSPRAKCPIAQRGMHT